MQECGDPSMELYGTGYDESVGRLLVATQDIEPGVTVLQDSALIAAPDGFPACLGCLAGVDGINSCSSCSWPSCGDEACAHHNTAECTLYKENSLVPMVKNFTQPNTMYAMVAVVRMMILKRDNPQQYEVIEQLMDHWSERACDRRVSELVKFMAAFCRKKLSMSWVKDEDVQHAFGVLKTNGVGHINKNGSKVCFLYPTVSLLSHSCAANLEIVDSPATTVKFVAKRKIRAGEELTWSYTNHLLPRHSMRDKLYQTWMFECQCLRCLDPSEFGLLYSSMRCVCGGYFCIWQEETVKCDKCEKQEDKMTIILEEQSMMKELSLADNADLCSILHKFEVNPKLHPTHHMMVRLYMRILESVARNCPDKELLAAALAQGPVLIKVLNILDGEEGKLVKKYSKMYSLVEYKDLIRMEEEGKLSQQEFQSKLEHLREKLM